MTADIIEQRFRLKGQGYEVVCKKIRPDGVPDKLRSPEPVLFHLEDPWDEIGPSPDAAAWSDALVKLLPQARADKKFLITTRSDLLHGASQAKALLPHVVRMEPEDYDDEARSRIYDGRLSRLRGRANELGRKFRDGALSTLRRPFELDRFFVNLQSSADEGPGLDHLLRSSQTEAIVGVVEGQILEGVDPDRSIAAAAVIWALTSTLPEAREAMVEDVRLRMRRLEPTFKVELDDFVDRMVLSRNVDRAQGLISIPHPQIERGFWNAMIRRKSEAEAALGLLVRALVDLDGDDSGRAEGWGADVANQLRRKVREVEHLRVDLRSDAVDALDERLEARVMAAHGPGFAKALDDLVALGGRSPLARFARCLRTRRGTRSSWDFGWALPDGSMAEAPSFGGDERCREVARRMITDVLPSTPSAYPVEMAAFLLAVDPGNEAVFLGVLSAEALPSFDPTNLRIIVRGALAASGANHDVVLDLFLRARKDLADDEATRREACRQAREGVLDAGFADHVLSEAGSEEHVIDVGLGEVLKVIRLREGWEWLGLHPRAGELAAAWREVARVDKRARPGIKEMNALLDLAASDDERASTWRVIAATPTAAMARRLDNAIAEPGLPSEVRHALLDACAAIHGAR